MNTNIVLTPTAVAASSLHTEEELAGNVLLAPALLQTCLPSSPKVGRFNQYASP